jgi:hypothetical protein
MNWEPTCDAIVTFPDALRWVEPLLKAKPDDVIDHALDVEPAVLGVAADIARRTCERLEKYGVSEQHREYIFKQCTLAGAMAIELMRRGNAQLWQDLIEPEEDK